jgi:glucosamine--fructose-6-phosphate aminotransferase (isomerizing)
MTTRQQIQEIPGALRQTLEKVRADYSAVVRKVRWGDGPILICGAGECAAFNVAAGYALESFPGWPVVARPVEVFQTYALPLLKQRTVLMVIARSGEWPEAQELLQTAKKRGCVLVVVTNTLESPLAKVADHVLFVPVEGDLNSPAATVCLQAALNFFGLEAARILKRPEPHWGQTAEEIDQLPGKMEWLLTQLPAMVRSFAAELAKAPKLRIVGGGFYQFPAWRAARQLQSPKGLQIEAVEAAEFMGSHGRLARQGDSVLLLSGSHSKIKKLLHRCAAQARANGARVLSITDGNDRDLVEGSDLGILIPTLLEAPASTLTLFMLEWVASETAKP